MLTKLIDSFYSKLSTLASFKTKRTCYNTNCKSAQIFGDTSNNRSSSSSRASSHTSSDEDHICATDSFRQCFFAFFSSFTTNLRLTSCTQTTSQFRSQLNNSLSFCTAQCLYICVCCDKFYACNTFVDHTVDGIATTSTDTNYFNHCTLSSSCIK